MFFSDEFGVAEDALKHYGALDISLDADVPVFIDPFRLYANEKYVELHEAIIKYLRFLRDFCEENKNPSKGQLEEYFHFAEVGNIHLGFCGEGHYGHGLGRRFAKALQTNLASILQDFGSERVSGSSHLEKLCIITDGVGRDTISDFTANLIKSYLLEYTEAFAKNHIAPDRCCEFDVERARFDFEKCQWLTQKFVLPEYDNSYVLLVPRDMLTRDDTWMNKRDLIDMLKTLPMSMGNEVLKSRLERMLSDLLHESRYTKQDRARIKAAFCRENPEVVDWYIKHKEDHKQEAVVSMDERIASFINARDEFINCLWGSLKKQGCNIGKPATYQEAKEKAIFFKHAVEDFDVYKVLYPKGVRNFDESTINHLFRLVWNKTDSDVNFEVNNGRGPADLKISKGARDKCIVEFKLASNSKLKQNLRNQVEIYKKANDTEYAITIIVCASDKEVTSVEAILQELGLTACEDVVVVDARPKVSASNAK